MSVDKRTRRLIDLKDAVKAYFEVTGAVGGGWKEGFRAVRRNEDMAESFLGDLKELLVHIEREFSGARDPMIEAQAELIATRGQRSDEDDDLAAVARSASKGAAVASPRREEHRLPGAPPIAYGPTESARPSPPAEAARPATRTAPYTASQRPASSTTPPARSAGSMAPPAPPRAATAPATTSSPKRGEDRPTVSIRPSMTAPLVTPSPSPRTTTSSRSPAAASSAGARSPSTSPSRDPDTDRTTVARAPTRSSRDIPAPPAPPRRFAPTEDFNGATRVESVPQFDLDDEDATGRVPREPKKRR